MVDLRQAAPAVQSVKTKIVKKDKLPKLRHDLTSRTN